MQISILELLCCPNHHRPSEAANFRIEIVEGKIHIAVKQDKGESFELRALNVMNAFVEFLNELGVSFDTTSRDFHGEDRVDHVVLRIK